MFKFFNSPTKVVFSKKFFRENLSTPLTDINDSVFHFVNTSNRRITLWNNILFIKPYFVIYRVYKTNIIYFFPRFYYKNIDLSTGHVMISDHTSSFRKNMAVTVVCRLKMSICKFVSHRTLTSITNIDIYVINYIQLLSTHPHCVKYHKYMYMCVYIYIYIRARVCVCVYTCVVICNV